MYKKCEEILKELENEEKVKVWWEYNFPSKQELKLRLKDMLEDEVDEKYYLSDIQINRIKFSNFKQEEKRIQEKEYCDTILSRDWKDSKCVRLGNIYGEDKGTGYAENVWDKEGLCPTIKTMQGGNQQPMITVKNATKKGYQEAYNGDSINLAYPESKTRRGRVGKEVAQTIQCNDNIGVVVVNEINANAKHQQDLIQTADDVCRTIPAGTHGSTPHLLKTVVDTNPLRIRKLTPRECWRLMGFDDEDFFKAKERLNNTFYKGRDKSNSQLYKQAGNSITVNVLEKIFSNLF